MNRGTKRPARPAAPQTLDLRAAIHNRFDVEVVDAATGRVKKKARAFNVICNALWTRLLNTSGGEWYPYNYFNYVLFGSGSGTPAATDTALFNKLGAKEIGNYSNLTVSVDHVNSLATGQAMVTIQAEEQVGATITEVGIGYDATNIVTHAMLEDMNGNPISIEKTATDVINIYATMFLHWSAGGWYGGSVNLCCNNASNYNSLVRVLFGKCGTSSSSSRCRFKLYGADKKTGGDVITPSRDIVPTISAADKQISIALRLAAAEANLPIRCINIRNAYVGYSSEELPAFVVTPGSWFTPPAISAEAAGTGDGSAAGFSTAFPVKTPGAVYVDGVQDSGATMRLGPADATHMEAYFNELRVPGLTAVGTLIYDNYTIVKEFYNSIRTDSISVGSVSPPLENPFYALGIASFSVFREDSANRITIQASDDCAQWTDVATASVSSSAITVAIPAEHQAKRFWRFKNSSTNSGAGKYRITATAAVADPSHNIIFSTPPAAGAVITCDYTPDCVAKDSNHVFDLSLVLTLGEYQEA